MNRVTSDCVTYDFNFAVWFDVIIIYESSKSCHMFTAINAAKRK